MDYLFLRRHRRTATSNRQKSLLLKAAERQWELQFANKGTEGRKVDCALYKCILYNLEIKQVFLDSELSLKKFSVMIDTNQTYLSNVVNKYFNCNLKELLNTYRVEYAKELPHAGKCSLEGILRDKSELQLKREAEAEVVREGNKLVIRSFYPKIGRASCRERV